MYNINSIKLLSNVVDANLFSNTNRPSGDSGVTFSATPSVFHNLSTALKHSIPATLVVRLDVDGVTSDDRAVNMY